jgi:hypothetical protein
MKLVQAKGKLTLLCESANCSSCLFIGRTTSLTIHLSFLSQGRRPLSVMTDLEALKHKPAPGEMPRILFFGQFWRFI